MSTTEGNRALTLAYARRSAVEAATEGRAEDGSRVTVALDGGRGTVGLRGRVRDAGLFRDAWMTAAAVLGSDLRHKARDRTAYLAHLAREGKRASAGVWEAQRAFLDRAFSEEVQARSLVPPVVTVDPDAVSLEVFSLDQSAYGRLSLASSVLDAREAAHGTSFVDLSDGFLADLDRLRAWAPVTLDLGGASRHGAEGTQEAIEVPGDALRGFLQVQSAAALPGVEASLAPVDLYNLLYALRARRAKTSPRALRFELVPGAPVRMVLEPWELVLESHGAPYAGPRPAVVRTFGRQRLLSLARILPYVKGARVRLLGSGLPVFWVLDLGVGSLTLGLTGWTESGWSTAASYDALTPPEAATALASGVLRRLLAQGPGSVESIARGVQQPVAETRAALQRLALRGQSVYDLASGLWRPRSLFAEAVDDAVTRFGSEHERRAHRLLAPEGAGEVRLVKVHDMVGEGVEIVGEVFDREAQRRFGPSFTLDLEGRAVGAQCGCSHFRRAAMREGPCEHMIALRLVYARQRAEAERQRNTPEGRRLIRAETRTLVKRDAAGKETVLRLSLDARAVAVQWGPRNAPTPRMQRLWFDSDREAREAYFARLEGFGAEGYIDADSHFA
jgi:hypothetical protein